MAEGLELEGVNKKVAILIAILAAALAVTEMGAKSSQTHVLTEQVESSNLWAFYQAKAMRQTIVRTAAEEVEARYKESGDMPAAVKAQAEAWKKTAARYESEPETKEGRKELAERAKEHEMAREEARHAYHLFEYGSAALQLAIVLASAGAITGAAFLFVLAGGLGIVGAALSTVGFLAPTLIHLG
jgi:hypothetical protein